MKDNTHSTATTLDSHLAIAKLMHITAPTGNDVRSLRELMQHTQANAAQCVHATDSAHWRRFERSKGEPSPIRKGMWLLYKYIACERVASEARIMIDRCNLVQSVIEACSDHER
jgi:hypothetical protein